MVSNPDDPSEAWPLIQSLPDYEICTITDQQSAASSWSHSISNDINTGHTHTAAPDTQKAPHTRIAHLPLVMHFCQHYRLGVYMFGKYEHGMNNIFDCEGSVLLEPPVTIGTMRHKVRHTYKYICVLHMYVLVMCDVM